MMFISKAIILAPLTALFASTAFVEAKHTSKYARKDSKKNNKKNRRDLRMRKLSVKLPKSHPSEICIQNGYSIVPDFEGVVDIERLYNVCCLASGWDPQNPSQSLYTKFLQCDENLKDDEEYQKCNMMYAMTYPFHHSNSNDETMFVFEVRDDALIGRSSFRGRTGQQGKGGEREVNLNYVTEESKIADLRLSDLEYIEYSFKVLECDPWSSLLIISCPEDIELELYSKSDKDPARSTGSYDCMFKFTPTSGGEVGGPWTTVRFSGLSTPSYTDCGGNPACSEDCVAGPNTKSGPNTKWSLVDPNGQKGYKIGYNENIFFSLKLKNGVDGLLDRVVVKLVNEDPLIYDL